MTDRPRPLPPDEFAFVVRRTPLVAVDLVLSDADGRILVGLRENEPAKGCYFVPGGVIRKNERIADAFARIVKTETGLDASLADARPLGAFEHFYETNFFGDASYGTHYVVLAYALRLTERTDIALDQQHSAVRWMSPTEILAASDVHANTKAYVR